MPFALNCGVDTLVLSGDVDVDVEVLLFLQEIEKSLFLIFLRDGAAAKFKVIPLLCLPVVSIFFDISDNTK